MSRYIWAWTRIYMDWKSRPTFIKSKYCMSSCRCHPTSLLQILSHTLFGQSLAERTNTYVDNEMNHLWIYIKRLTPVSSGCSNKRSHLESESSHTESAALQEPQVFGQRAETQPTLQPKAVVAIPQATWSLHSCCLSKLCSAAAFSVKQTSSARINDGRCNIVICILMTVTDCCMQVEIRKVYWHKCSSNMWQGQIG